MQSLNMLLICCLGLPGSVAKVLVSIGNAGLHHLHPHVVSPVVAQLAGPLKVGGVSHISVHKLLHNITSMHIQSDQRTQGQSVLQQNNNSVKVWGCQTQSDASSLHPAC